MASYDSNTIGIIVQLLWVLLSLALLMAWVTQFNRFTSRDETPVVDSGNLMLVGLGIILLCLESADPFGDRGTYFFKKKN